MKQKKHSHGLVEAFKPIRWYLTCIGQMPFRIINKVDGTHAFQFKWCSCATFSFAAVTILYSFMYVMITIGWICCVMDFFKSTAYVYVADVFGNPRGRRLPWDEVMFKNHIVIIVIYWTWLTVTFVGSMYILINAHDYVHYFNYWNRVVQIIDMDLTTGIRHYVWSQTYEIGLSIIVLAFLFSFVVAFRASSGVIACFLFKMIVSDLPDREWFIAAEILSFLLVVYGFVGTKAIIMQFVFFTRLLKNGTICWNNRLRNTLHKKQGGVSVSTVDIGVDGTEDQDCRRISYTLVLKDHFIIVQLFKLTEVVFALLLQFYYLSRMVCILVEILFLYYLLGPEHVEVIAVTNTSIPGAPPPTQRPLTIPEEFARDQKIIASWLVILLLVETLTSSYITNEHATTAHLEAMKGFHIVRKHGFINCTGSAEKNFIHSLVVSFARSNPMAISPGGYFLINKSIVVAVLGTVCAYFIILIQFDRDWYKVDPNAFKLGNWF